VGSQPLMQRRSDLFRILMQIDEFRKLVEHDQVDKIEEFLSGETSAEVQASSKNTKQFDNNYEGAFDI